VGGKGRKVLQGGYPTRGSEVRYPEEGENSYHRGMKPTKRKKRQKGKRKPITKEKKNIRKGEKGVVSPKSPFFAGARPVFLKKESLQKRRADSTQQKGPEEARFQGAPKVLGKTIFRGKGKTVEQATREKTREGEGGYRDAEKNAPPRKVFVGKQGVIQKA